MSELKKYECTVLIDASCSVTVEASSPEEAAELAENAAAEQGAGSLCHQCSDHTECGDSYAVIVYGEDGDEVLDTDYRSGQLKAAQSELAALREELAKFDEGMRALACSLGAGGYNAETLTADQLVGKVQWGIDNIITVQEQRLTAAEQRNSQLKLALKLARPRVERELQGAIEENFGYVGNDPEANRLLDVRNAIDVALAQPTESGASE